MEKVKIDKRKQVWNGLLGWGEISHVEKVYYSHFTQKEKTHACSDMYVNCCPKSSWEHLTSLLYEEDEMTAVDQARPFLPPRGYLVLIAHSDPRPANTLYAHIYQDPLNENNTVHWICLSCYTGINVYLLTQISLSQLTDSWSSLSQ